MLKSIFGTSEIYSYNYQYSTARYLEEVLWYSEFNEIFKDIIDASVIIGDKYFDLYAYLDKREKFL